MTFSVTISSAEYSSDCLEIFKFEYLEDKEIRLLIMTTHEREDEDSDSYEVTEGQAITVNLYELLRAIEAVAILPSQ